MIVRQLGVTVGVDIGDRTLWNESDKRFDRVRSGIISIGPHSTLYGITEVVILDPVIIYYPPKYTGIAELK